MVSLLVNKSPPNGWSHACFICLHTLPLLSHEHRINHVLLESYWEQHQPRWNSSPYARIALVIYFFVGKHMFCLSWSRTCLALHSSKQRYLYSEFVISSLLIMICWISILVTLSPILYLPPQSVWKKVDSICWAQPLFWWVLDVLWL